MVFLAKGARARNACRSILIAVLLVASAMFGFRPAAASTTDTVLENRPIGLPSSPSARLPRGNVATFQHPSQSSLTRAQSRQSFVLRDVTVTGAADLPGRQVASTWTHLRGKRVTIADVQNIADRLSALCKRHDFAIYRVNIPRQPITGHLRIDVVIGRVAHVAIMGDVKNADLWLLRHYAAAIVADRPLHQATLERYILLMNALPGLAVSSSFQAAPGQPDGVELVLSITRKRFEYGFGFDNAGQSALGRTEVEANVAIDNLFGEGDKTQLVYGMPVEARRFQYLSLTHIEPLGTDGATVTLSAADLLTHPLNRTAAGNAYILGAQVADPLIETVHTNLVGILGFDTINSDEALLGTTISDERTRSIRVRLRGATDQWFDGVGAFDLGLGHGIGAFGARRGTIAFGSPEYTKLSLRLTREQHLPWGLIVRGKAVGQYSLERLPGSEQFAFGGLDFGQAFQAVTLTGDRAAAAAVELAHNLPAFANTRFNSGTEAFALTDWGEVWNIRTPYFPNTNRGASLGFGVRTKVLGKVTVQAEATDAIIRPVGVASNAGWTGFVGLTGTF